MYACTFSREFSVFDNGRGIFKEYIPGLILLTPLMGSCHDMADAVIFGYPEHLHGRFEFRGAVVHSRQDMAVDVDHEQTPTA
jgi:hypothetical protein